MYLLVPLLLHRLWKPRSRRRTGCVCPNRTSLQSRAIGDRAPLSLNGHLPRSPREPLPQQSVLQTSLQPTLRSRTRTKLQTHRPSMENLKAFQSMEGLNQSHLQEVGVCFLFWIVHLSCYSILKLLFFSHQI